MKRVLLINPNTNSTTTASMLAIARNAAPDWLQIEAMTAPEGVGMITDTEALEQAGGVLSGLIPFVRDQRWDGIVIAAYGDPALADLRAGLDCPVTGIGEASMMAAAQLGPFAIVTTTPDLCASILAMVARSGFESLCQGVFLTMGDAETVTRDAVVLEQRLEEACRKALVHAPLAAIIIGGGPLARAAQVLSPRLPVRLIEPVPTAIQRIADMLGDEE